jgi:hypothetical protein
LIKKRQPVSAAFFVIGSNDMNDEYSVLIVGGAVVLVPVTEELAPYDDLIECLLLAQLAANKKIEKTAEIDWYGAYVQLLDNYWLRHSRARRQWSIEKDNVESLGDWVLTAMFSDAVDNSGAASVALRRLAGLSGTEPAMGLLRRHIQKSILASESGDGLASATSVRLLVVVANTPTSLTSVYLELATDRVLGGNPLAELFQAEDVRGDVCMRYAGAYLSETLYAPARAAVALKIRDRLKDNVVRLTLPDEGAVRQLCAAD